MLSPKDGTMFDNRLGTFPVFYYDSRFSAIERQQLHRPLQRINSVQNSFGAPTEICREYGYTGATQFSV